MAREDRGSKASRCQALPSIVCTRRRTQVNRFAMLSLRRVAAVAVQAPKRAAFVGPMQVATMTDLHDKEKAAERVYFKYVAVCALFAVSAFVYLDKGLSWRTFLLTLHCANEQQGGREVAAPTAAEAQGPG